MLYARFLLARKCGCFYNGGYGLQTYFTHACVWLGLRDGNFESYPAGETGDLSTMYGCLSGDALISTGAARSGKQFLRIKCAKNRCVKLTFTEPLADVAVLNFWVQRWTAKGAFHLQVVAETPDGTVVVQNNVAAVVQEYKQAQAVLPAGTTGVKLICSSIEGGGALVDDVELLPELRP